MCELSGSQTRQEEGRGTMPESDSGATVAVSVAGEEGLETSLCGQVEC